MFYLQDDVDPGFTDRESQARLSLWLVGVLFMTTGFATLFRPLAAEMHPLFTWMGVLNTCLFGGLWLLFRNRRWAPYAPYVLIALCHLMGFPLLLLSGGPNSQFSSLIPLYPVFCALLGSRKLAVSVLLFWMVAIPAMYFLGRWVPDLSGEVVGKEKTAARTFWLMLSSFIALLFTLQFFKRLTLLQAQLRAQAEMDPLTGLGNRRKLDKALGREIASARRHNRWITLMMIDVDHFKLFNDSRGHAEGDQALCKVGEVLVGQTRRGQDTVVRFGGEEFVIVLGETDTEQARKVADKICTAISELELPYMVADAEDEPQAGGSSLKSLTVTIGLVSGKGSRLGTSELLLRLADNALYKGKLSGRDCIIAEEC